MEKYFIELLPEIIWKTENVPNELTELGKQIDQNRKSVYGTLQNLALASKKFDEILNPFI